MVWIVGGGLSLLGALTYAELAAANPEAGGLYCYIRDGFGALPAFLYGWCLFVVIASGTIAALARALTKYLNEIVQLREWQSNAIWLGDDCRVMGLRGLAIRHIQRRRSGGRRARVSEGVSFGFVVPYRAVSRGGAGISGCARSGGSFHDRRHRRNGSKNGFGRMGGKIRRGDDSDFR